MIVLKNNVEMRTIKLTRPNEKYNKDVNYKIKNSKGITIDTIANNTTIELLVQDDIEFFEVKMLWCGSNKIQLVKTQFEAEFIITGNKYFNKILPLSGAFFGLITIFTTINIISRSIGIAIVTLSIFYIFLCLTILKDKWLNYEEVL